VKRDVDRWISAWARPGLGRAARLLIYVAAGLLFLEAAGTIQAVYTLRLSYLAALLAVCVGGGFVIQGWQRLPAVLRWCGIGLFVVYATATAVGHPLTLPGQPRTGSIRSVAYLGDLGLGLASVALIAGVVVTPKHVRRLIWSFVVGGLVGGAYALYQWFAQHYGWPYANVNNTLDSNGITVGVYQGSGLHGWERARGTFIEPHFLADYAGSLLPLALGIAIATAGRTRYIAVGATLALGAALAVTSSAPEAAIFLCALVLSGACLLVGRGAVLRATAVSAVAASLTVIGPLALTLPSAVAAATGRSQLDVAATIGYRSDTWRRALEIWAQRPVLGYGAGQSSVQLAAETDVPPDQRTATALQSAQGIWAASLIDAGVIGLGAWLLFLAGIVTYCFSMVRRRAGALTWATAAALTAAVASAQITGDRLDLRVWLLMGLTAALFGAGRETPAQEPAGRDE
jgi:O-Antigen ligase